jgi:hypothetical protein
VAGPPYASFPASAAGSYFTTPPASTTSAVPFTRRPAYGVLRLRRDHMARTVKNGLFFSGPTR